MVSQGDNNTMVVLTERAQKDSRTVKLIAYITMAYFPGSFVAVRRRPMCHQSMKLTIPEHFQHELCKSSFFDF